MLLKLNQTSADGRTKQVIVSSEVIKEIAPDDREDFASKAIIITNTGFRYYVTETFEELCSKLKL